MCHRGDAGGEVTSGSRQPAAATAGAAAADAKRRRPSGKAGAAGRGRMAPPAPKFTQDPLASQAAGNKGSGLALDLFGSI